MSFAQLVCSSPLHGDVVSSARLIRSSALMRMHWADAAPHQSIIMRGAKAAFITYGPKQSDDSGDDGDDGEAGCDVDDDDGDADDDDDDDGDDDCDIITRRRR